MLVGYKFISQEIDKLEDFISAGDEIHEVADSDDSSDLNQINSNVRGPRKV